MAADKQDKQEINENSYVVKSLFMHALLLGIVLYFSNGGGASWERVQQMAAAAQPKVIEAKVINNRDLQKEIARMKKIDPPKEVKQEEPVQEAVKVQEQKEAEEKRVAEQKVKQEKAAKEEQLKLQEQKEKAEALALKQEQIKEEKRKAEQNRLEEVKKAEAKLKEEKLKEAKLKEEKKKAEELAKAKEEEKAKKLAEEKEKAEQAKEAERAKEQERIAKMEEQRRQEQAARDRDLSAVVDKFGLMIKSKVTQNWVAQGVEAAQACVVKVRLGAGGMVLDVELITSSGSPALDRSAIAAIYKSSPLPVPSDPDAFDKIRELRLTLKPEDIISTSPT